MVYGVCKVASSELPCHAGISAPSTAICLSASMDHQSIVQNPIRRYEHPKRTVDGHRRYELGNHIIWCTKLSHRYFCTTANLAAEKTLKSIYLIWLQGIWLKWRRMGEGREPNCSVTDNCFISFGNSFFPMMRCKTKSKKRLDAFDCGMRGPKTAQHCRRGR